MKCSLNLSLDPEFSQIARTAVAIMLPDCWSKFTSSEFTSTAQRPALLVNKKCFGIAFRERKSATGDGRVMPALSGCVAP
jgi:hypothetical protein